MHYALFRNVYDEVLPDFSRLGKPAAEWYISAFSLEDVPFSANEYDFAIVFTSKMRVKEAGVYKLELSSDDGSKLFIDGKPLRPFFPDELENNRRPSVRIHSSG